MWKAKQLGNLPSIFQSESKCIGWCCCSSNMCKRRINANDKILSHINFKYGCIVGAVQQGNVSDLRYYLEIGGDPNKVCTSDNLSLLSACVQSRRVGLVQCLTNHQDTEVHSADIQWAIKAPGYVACQEIAILLTTKARPEAVSGHPELLQWASVQNNTELVQHLLAAGAKVPGSSALIQQTLLEASGRAPIDILLRKSFMQPHTLASIARIAVRQHIRRIADIETLTDQLPEALIDFLSLRIL